MTRADCQDAIVNCAIVCEAMLGLEASAVVKGEFEQAAQDAEAAEYWALRAFDYVRLAG